MKSPRDIYNRALNLLGVVGAGQTADAEDIDVCRLVLPSLLAELRTIDAGNFFADPQNDDAANFPDAAFLPISALLAYEVSQDFGVPRSNLAPRDELLRRMLSITSDGPLYLVQEAKYY